jgi:tetratricopeptide (TPR) repeat protein
MAKTANPSEWTVEYERLRDLGTEKLEAEKYAEALECFERASEIAEKIGDRNTVDLAFCNRAALAFFIRKPGDWTGQLQAMLLRTTDAKVARFAAYNLARFYDRENNLTKAMFYARIALRHSAELGSPDLQASALDLLGNAHVALNDFESGSREYEKALELLGDSPSVRRAVVLANAAYPKLLRNDIREGMSDLFWCLRYLKTQGVRFYQINAHLSLAFGYLLLERPVKAIHHAARALDLAEEFDSQASVKYSLLMIGEAYKIAGDSPAARQCFDILQETYYPDKPEVPAMLLGLDLCKVINLRA